MNLLFEQIAKKWKTCNMNLERILKEIKLAMPRFKNEPPYAETLCTMTSLDQCWRHHLNEGGKNPFDKSREDLVASGLPVAKFRRTIRKI